MVYGKWIFYCLLRCQLVQISNRYPKDFKVLIYCDKVQVAKLWERRYQTRLGSFHTPFSGIFIKPKPSG